MCVDLLGYNVVMTELEKVGRVEHVFRYLVKSMQAEELDTAEVNFKGIRADRSYAFIKEGDKSGFPWFTARDNPNMILYTPIETSEGLDIKLPNGETLPIGSLELKRLLIEGSNHSKNIELVKIDRGAFDGYPISVLGKGTLDAVSKRTGVALDPLSFRPNIVINSLNMEEGVEDSWVNKILKFGSRPDSPEIFVVKKDTRCMMINIDPITGIQRPEILRDVVKNRNREMGVYANPIKMGNIKPGDEVFIKNL